MSQDVKCLSVGQRVMSVPISESSRRGVVRADAVELREVNASELMEWGPELEARFIVARFLSRARGRQRRGGASGLDHQRLEMRLACRVTGGEALLHVVEGCHILPEPKDVFRSIVPRERGDDLGLGRVAPIVAVLGELLRVAVAGHDVAKDPQPRDTRDVTHDEGQLDVHLHQRLLHALDIGPRRLDEGLAVSEIRAEGDDAISGPEAAAQKADDVQVAEPFAIRDITLASRYVLDVAGVHEEDREAARLQDLVEGDPVHPGGFHRDTGHAAGREPVGEALEIAGKRRERSDRCGIAIGRDGDKVFGRPAIDSGRIRIDVFQDGGRDTGLRCVTTALAFHGRLLYTVRYASGNRDADEWQSPKRDHAGGRVTSDDAANPRATLTHGLTAPVAARPRFLGASP